MRKILLKIHLWLAIPLGLLITVICLSGAVLVFRTELEEAFHPQRYFAEQTGEAQDKLSLKQLALSLESQLPDETLSGFTVPSDPTRNYIVSLASNPRLPVYVNPYTGMVVHRESGGGFFHTTMLLHRWLLAKPDVGRPIVGYTTLFFVLILISGIIVILPKSRKKLIRIFTVHLRKGWKRFWYDLHIGAGLWVSIVLLALALTGLTWSFRWYSEGFYRVLGAEAPAPRGGGGGHGGGREGSRGGEQRGGGRSEGRPNKRSEIPWDALLSKVAQENPDYKTISIRGNNISVTQRQRFGNSRASDSYAFDAATGEITEYTPYANQPRTAKIRGWIYSIHVGSWGGIFSKTISCIASLIGASLPLTGYYIFWRKRRRKILSLRA